MKKILKWLGLLLLLIGLIIGGLYFSAPYWLPSQVQGFLPDNIKLLKLESNDIGFSSAKLDDLQLKIEGETPLQLNLQGIQLHYSLWAQSLSSVSVKAVQITLSASEKQSDDALPTQINLPSLPLDKISIDSLSLKGLTLQRLDFSKLSLSQSKDKIVVQGFADTFDIKSEFSAVIQSQQQILSSVSTFVKSQSKLLPLELQLDLSPQEDNRSWRIAGDINLQESPLLPLEGLSQLEMQLDVLLNRQQGYDLTFNHNNLLTAKLDLEQTQIPKQLQQSLKQIGVLADLSPLSQQTNLQLSFNDPTKLSYQPDEALQSNRLKLQSGQLILGLDNSLAKLQLELTRLDLDLQQALDASQQMIEAKLKTQLHINSLGYQNQRLHFSTSNLNADLMSHIQLSSAVISIKHEKGKLQLAPSKIVTENGTFNLKPSYWNTNAEFAIDLGSEATAISQQNIAIALSKASQLSARLKTDNNQANRLKSIISKANATISKNAINSNYQLKATQLPAQNLSIASIKGSALYQLQSRLLTGKTSVAGINYNNAEFSFKKINADIDWSKKDNDILLSGFLKQKPQAIPETNNTEAKIPFTYQINIATDKHKVLLSPMRLDLETLQQWLSPTLENFSNLSISGSHLTTQSIKGDPLELAFEGKLLFESLNLNYDEFKVKHWQMKEQLNPQDALLGQSNNTIETIEIASGINLSKISFILKHTLTKFVIEHFTASLLDGGLSFSRLAIEKSPQNLFEIEPLVIKLKAIDIAQLLSSLESESLQITGKFDLDLPLTITTESQSIKDGVFNNVTPGVLKIENSDGEAANIAYQALENFHYSEFSGTVNYSAEGNYTILLHLLGANPDLYDGFPIKLDLTLRGTLPDLLYSMLITGDMSKPILEDIKQHAEPGPETDIQP